MFVFNIWLILTSEEWLESLLTPGGYLLKVKCYERGTNGRTERLHLSCGVAPGNAARVYRFKYLGHILSPNLKDDEDIEWERRRALSVKANMLARRSEWDRLEKQASAPEKPSQQENEYLKAMIEKSQEWMKSWPDTVQGCVALKENKKEKQRAEEIAAVEAFSKKKIRINNAEAIQNAKQKIFDRSCYGTKLISALHESKAMEERDAQIDFTKKIKEKEAELERKKLKTVMFCTFNLDKNKTAVENLQKCKRVQNARQNKEMYEKKKEEEAKAKEEAKLADLTDAQLIKHLLDREQEAEGKIKLLEKQALEQYTAEHKKTKEERAKWEAEYYEKIEKCRKEQEDLNCKIRNVHIRLCKESTNLTIPNTFEIVKKFQEEEKKRYEEFIEKNSKKGEERAAKREQKAKEKTIQDRNKKITIADVNKLMAEYVNQRQCSYKCFCDRQCLITKSDKPRIVRQGRVDIEPEPECKERPLRPAPYFGPCNKLLSALKRREEEPSPWTGVEQTHVLFKRNADKTLSECKYKMPARKVVDEYRKYNALDETTLSITNYK